MFVKAFFTKITNVRTYDKKDGTQGHAVEYVLSIPVAGTNYSDEMVAERFFDEPQAVNIGPTGDNTLYDVNLAMSISPSKDGGRYFQRTRISKISVPC